MNDVDQTINAICGWIEKELESKETMVAGCSILPEMIKALAELAKARAQICNTFHRPQGYSHALCNDSKVQ